MGGALVADMTPQSFGVARRNVAGIPIPYARYYKQIGEAFKGMAQATCPVDTGFLQQNIGYNTDGGGVEMWSDAQYSAYQEYGTSKMAAQPYFDASVFDAISMAVGGMQSLEGRFEEIGNQLMELNHMAGNEFSIGECQMDLAMCDHILSFFMEMNFTYAADAGWTYNLAPIYEMMDAIQMQQEILEEEARQQQMQQQAMMEQMNQGKGSSLGGGMAGGPNLLQAISMTILIFLFLAPLMIVDMIIQDAVNGDAAGVASMSMPMLGGFNIGAIGAGCDDGHYPIHSSGWVPAVTADVGEIGEDIDDYHMRTR